MSNPLTHIRLATNHLKDAYNRYQDKYPDHKKSTRESETETRCLLAKDEIEKAIKELRKDTSQSLDLDIDEI